MTAKRYIPAISIIVPSFNVERYVEQCLKSILNQTFGDYEVLVIDDGSTDRTVEIVESCVDRFDGRLRLIRMKKNTGGAAQPRNVGIRMSRGEYITFVDADDMITRTALEKLYKVAVETNADVLHTEKYFITAEEVVTPKSTLKIKTSEHQTNLHVKQLTVEPSDFGDRIRRYVQGRYFWYPWGKLFRRDLIVENGLEFPDLPTAEDQIFCFKALCLAERYVRTPVITNLYRTNPESLTKKTLDVPGYVRRWLRVMIEGVRLLDGFMSGVEYFSAHPDQKFDVINFFVHEKLLWLSRAREGRDVHEFDRLLRAELDKSEDGALIAYLINAVLFYRTSFVNHDRQLAEP